jgi:alkylhydroperoxidase family enzyme
MARLLYATPQQLAELIRLCGLPENTPHANAFRMFAHAPAIGAATLRLVFALLTETELDAKLRELVILHVSQRCHGRYAWVQHVAVARPLGVSDAQIVALESAETPAALFNERERAAFAFADEVLDSCWDADDTFAQMRALYAPREIVELLLLIGYFRMICGVMTTLEVEVESPFGAKILDALRDPCRSHD